MKVEQCSQKVEHDAMVKANNLLLFSKLEPFLFFLETVLLLLLFAHSSSSISEPVSYFTSSAGRLSRSLSRRRMHALKSIVVFCFPAKELAENSHVQDAFVIAVEQQAKERLERLSALRKIKPVDMTKLSQQVRTGGEEANKHCGKVWDKNPVSKKRLKI